MPPSGATGSKCWKWQSSASANSWRHFANTAWFENSEARAADDFAAFEDDEVFTCPEGGENEQVERADFSVPTAVHSVPDRIFSVPIGCFSVQSRVFLVPAPWFFGTFSQVMPRNHRVEEALSAAEDHDDLSVLHRLLRVLAPPYEAGADSVQYRDPPPDDRSYRTFCGT